MIDLPRCRDRQICNLDYERLRRVRRSRDLAHRRRRLLRRHRKRRSRQRNLSGAHNRHNRHRNSGEQRPATLRLQLQSDCCRQLGDHLSHAADLSHQSIPLRTRHSHTRTHIWPTTPVGRTRAAAGRSRAEPQTPLAAALTHHPASCRSRPQTEWPPQRRLQFLPFAKLSLPSARNETVEDRRTPGR